jgi:hypothetical protein
MRNHFLGLIFCSVGFLLMLSCENEIPKEINPPAAGFNLEGSDKKAIEIADAVMEASGGRVVWDSTQYLQWNFFGRRLHKWNKKTNDIEITIPSDSLNIVMNLDNMTGTIMSKEETVSDEKAIQAYLQRGKEMWINDSYWIFMPFKLKDSGVTLKYLGESTTSKGAAAEKLELTFEGVGVTPENKYHIYVDKASNLVSQWDFFSTYEDEEARFSNPWEEYKDYEGLQLSSSRGGERKMTDIAVGNTVMMK